MRKVQKMMIKLIRGLRGKLHKVKETMVIKSMRLLRIGIPQNTS